MIILKRRCRQPIFPILSLGEVPTKSRCEIIKRVRATRKNTIHGHVRDGVIGSSRAPQTWWMEEPSAHARMYVFDVHLFENFERVNYSGGEIFVLGNSGTPGEIPIFPTRNSHFPHSCLEKLPLSFPTLLIYQNGNR